MSGTSNTPEQQSAGDGRRRIRVPLAAVGSVIVSFTESGGGRPVLLLHGGGGSLTVNAFAERFAADADAGVHVIAPVHPGFEGTERPDGLDSIRGWPSSTSTCSTRSASPM